MGGAATYFLRTAGTPVVTTYPVVGVGRGREDATPWSLAQREGAHTGSRTRDLILTKNALYLY